MIHAHRTLAYALFLVAAGSLVFATGAAVVDGPADTVADGDLRIQPADGPNGQYAYLNNDDEITVDISASNPKLPPDFEGVNPDSIASAGGVFEITYTGDEYAHVWIGDESEQVTFVADGESIEGEANNVTLAPNETVAVGLALDARGATAGTQLGADQFSIEAKIAEPDDVTATGGSTQRTGAPTTTVTSPGSDRREFTGSDIRRGDTVRFPADGMHLNGANVTMEGIDLEGVRNERVELNAVGSPAPFENAGALRATTTPRSMAYLALDYDFAPDAVDRMTIRFSADRDHLDASGVDPEDVSIYRQTDAGEWEEKPVEVVDEDIVEMLGLPEDRVHFRATTTEFSTFAVAERVPRFDVTEATVTPEAMEPGDTATVRATLRNGGGAAGERAVTLTADGDPVATETVALAPNESTTLSFDATVETAGAYDLAVDGTRVGTVVVGDPADDDTGGQSQAGDDTADAAGGPAESDSEGPTEEVAGILIPRLMALIVALLVSLIGIAVYRRRPQS